MQNALTAPTLTTLEAAVLECIVYGDLFDFPLTPAELHGWLPVAATSEEVAAALSGDRLAMLVSSVPPYVTPRGREHTVALRERRGRSSAALHSQAERYGRLIGRLPFVRMVAVTGSLAVDNADDGDDLDYLIVTAPGRVWLTRAMTMAVVRVAGLRGVTVCPNYLLAETALALADHDYYTARELLQMRPVTGHAVYERMLAVNGWWREYLPNAPHPPTPSPCGEKGRGHDSGRPELVEGRGPPIRAPRASLPRRVAEAVLALPPFDALERWVLAHKGAELRGQPGGNEAVFDETMCKGHFDRWRERTQQRLQERLREVMEAAP